MSAYAAAAATFAELAHLEDALQMLGWDEAVLLPSGATEARAGTLAGLAVLQHRQLTADRLHDQVQQAVADKAGLEPWQQANLTLMADRVARARAVPARLVEAQQLAASRCQAIWAEARPSDNWPAVQPALAEVLALAREQAQALAEALGLAPYDTLLTAWQPGLAAAEVDRVFAELEAFLPPFVDAVLGRQQAALDLPGPFPSAAQAQLGERLMGLLGFDFSRGRLDTSAHPFCGGLPDDCRITTRYREDSLLEALLGVLHETGHGLYQQGLPAAWRGQPVGDAAGMAVHESQSLLMEMMACRSRGFATVLAPLVRDTFSGGSHDPAWSSDNLYRLLTRVERGYIRVDADEVTYPLHVIMRYRLEQDLLNGGLALADLPEAWDAGMAAGLGLRTGQQHGIGCMQDIHWYAGLFGYFPSYTLGAMAAAQFFAAATAADAAIEPAIGRGDFAPLVNWLRREVHGRGQSLGMPDLLRAATGKPLDAQAFLAHLQRRYGN